MNGLVTPLMFASDLRGSRSSFTRMAGGDRS
jgi:hypothetical protein